MYAETVPLEEPHLPKTKNSGTATPDPKKDTLDDTISDNDFSEDEVLRVMLDELDDQVSLPDGISTELTRDLSPSWEKVHTANIDLSASMETAFSKHQERAEEVRKKALKKLEKGKKQRSLLDGFNEYELAKYNGLWFNNSLKKEEFIQNNRVASAVFFKAVTERLVSEFQKAQATLNLTPEEAAAYIDTVRDTAFGKLKEPSEMMAQRAVAAEDGVEINIPDVAPALYKDRSDRKEKPDAFIKREYARWLGPEDKWPRKLLDELDPPLYLAVSRYGLSKELDTKLYKTVGSPKKIGTPQDSFDLAKRRESNRKSMKRYRAKNKNAKP